MASITYKDQQIEVTKFTLAQRLEHLKYLRNHYMDGIKEQMRGLPLPLCESIWDKARAAVSRIDLGTNEHKAESFSADSMAYALWLALKDKIKGFSLHNALEVMEADLDGIPIIIAFDILGFQRTTPPQVSSSSSGGN